MPEDKRESVKALEAAMQDLRAIIDAVSTDTDTRLQALQMLCGCAIQLATLGH